MKYRKKPELVDAVQWTGDNTEDVQAMVIAGSRASMTSFWRDKDRSLILMSGDTTEVANPGDWVIHGSDGMLTRCNQLEFGLRYELVPPPWIETARGKDGAG